MRSRKMRNKIEIGNDIQGMVVQMSEGNIGAVTVLMQLLEQDALKGVVHILNLDDMNIRGSQIWIGYKDHCGENIEKFKECLSDRDQEMVNVINLEGERGNHEEVAVCHGSSFR